MYKRWYHVTLRANAESIIEHGLLPECSRGKRKAVYLVTRRALMWAIAHVSARHNVSVNELCIFTVHADPRGVINSNYPDLKYSTAVLQPFALFWATDLVQREPVTMWKRTMKAGRRKKKGAK